VDSWCRDRRRVAARRREVSSRDEGGGDSRRARRKRNARVRPAAWSDALPLAAARAAARPAGLVELADRRDLGDAQCEGLDAPRPNTPTSERIVKRAVGRRSTHPRRSRQRGRGRGIDRVQHGRLIELFASGERAPGLPDEAIAAKCSLGARRVQRSPSASLTHPLQVENNGRLAGATGRRVSCRELASSGKGTVAVALEDRALANPLPDTEPRAASMISRPRRARASNGVDASSARSDRSRPCCGVTDRLVLARFGERRMRRVRGPPDPARWCSNTRLGQTFWRAGRTSER
jgi:hypothetical protein